MGSKDWWTPSTTEEEPEYKWTTESIEEWPSKKEDEPSKDSKDSKDLKDSKDSKDSKKDSKYKDQINLLSKDSNKYSAASANGETDGTSAPTPAPTDDDMKDAFIIVWNPLDLLTFVQ